MKIYKITEASEYLGVSIKSQSLRKSGWFLHEQKIAKHRKQVELSQSLRKSGRFLLEFEKEEAPGKGLCKCICVNSAGCSDYDIYCNDECTPFEGPLLEKECTLDNGINKVFLDDDHGWKCRVSKRNTCSRAERKSE